MVITASFDFVCIISSNLVEISSPFIEIVAKSKTFAQLVYFSTDADIYIDASISVQSLLGLFLFALL